jgi:peptidoglycan-associated lipoprotein
MKISKVRFVESFVVVTFPIALAAGCTATGEHKPASAEAQQDMQQEVAAQQGPHITVDDLNMLSFVEQLDYDTSKEPEETSQPANTDTNTGTAHTGEVAEADILPVDTKSGQESELVKVNVKVPEPAKIEKPEKELFHFAVSKYDVDASDLKYLEKHALYLKANPGLILNVNGYSDSRGPKKLNHQLSQKRAQQIANILITYGAPESQIEVNAYGESFPLNDEKNWDENRRVELQYRQSHQPQELMAKF